MKNNRLSALNWGDRSVMALLFMAIGSLIMVVFSPWRPLLSSVADYLGRIGVTVFLLAVVLLASRRWLTLHVRFLKRRRLQKIAR
jgi:hypothetical protein